VLDGAPGRLLTVREAARMLGVSTATVYKLCARGELTHVRVLNVIRIPSGAMGTLHLRSRGAKP
jgi:excisionase family DNA binding protein